MNFRENYVLYERKWIFLYEKMDKLNVLLPILHLNMNIK